MNAFRTILFSIALSVTILFLSCNENAGESKKASNQNEAASDTGKYLSQPLVTHIYTADPSAHVFNGRIYVYPSHDTATGTPEDDLGSHFDMRDFHVLSMDSIGGSVTDHGVALDIKNIPWARRQLWAPDAAYANGTYYLYFPVKNKQDIFQIGVATSNKPEGPFMPEAEAIKGSYSIDPAVFKDDDGSYYMYFGGIWGGQLQRWNNNRYDSTKGNRKAEEPAVHPRVAKLSSDMKSFAGPVKEIRILDTSGQEYFEKDSDKRFFEGSWMFNSLKVPGCLKKMENIISPIPRVIHISWYTRLGLRHTVHLPIRE
jgi:GH43 family beta-xylosidase